MRLYTHKTEQYLHMLSISLEKSPLSFEGWHCFRLQPGEDNSWDLDHLASIKDEYAGVDGDIILTNDKDILIISKEMKVAEMEQLAMQICLEYTNIFPATHIYQMSKDWRALRVMLKHKLVEAHPVPLLLDNDVEFGEVDALRDVFMSVRHSRKSRQPQYVMVVDDDSLTRHLITAAFKTDYAMITASGAEEAVAHYLLYAPDVVFLDINMPDISGFSVLRQILATDPEAYVVMCSGNSYLDNMTKALANGAAAFVAKPFKKEKLHYFIEASQLHHAKASHQDGYYA